MKNLLLMAIMLVFASNAKAQENGEVYQFTQSEEIKACSETGTVKNPEEKIGILPPAKFIIRRKMDNGDLVVEILRWPVKADADGTTLTGIKKSYFDNNVKFRGGQGATTKLFLMTAAQMKTSAKKTVAKSEVSFATGSTLIKYRPGTKTIGGEIGNNLNIGIMAAFTKTKDDEKSHSFIVGATFGSIKLTPTNTNKKIEADADVAAFSPTVGYIYQVKGGQIGLMTGIDILSGSYYRSWVYRGRPWIGFGIGFNLFKIGGKSIITDSQ